MEKDELLKHISSDVLELNPGLVGGDKVAKNKFNAVKTDVDGHRFDSKKEARRYVGLKAMQDRGKISNLVLQPRFELIPKFVTPQGEKIQAMTYSADFMYSVTDEYGISIDIVEDVKSVATQTQVFIIKWKLLKFLYRDKPSYEFRIID